jgi:hypothetical protein
MHVIRTSSAAFTVTFDSEEELREQHRLNLAHGALLLATAERVALNETLLVTLRGPWGGEAFVRATAVAMMGEGVALALDGDPEERLGRLLAREGGGGTDSEESTDNADSAEKRRNAWDRIRALSQIEKLLLAVKAERSERALLLQDNDPRVLLSLLRNPRITVDEIARVAKSAFVNFQIVDVIVKTTQWMASLDVRLALVRNPKTPPPFALQILPTLPEAEVRTIARTGTSMALKQAALRRLQGKI